MQLVLATILVPVSAAALVALGLWLLVRAIGAGLSGAVQQRALDERIRAATPAEGEVVGHETRSIAGIPVRAIPRVRFVVAGVERELTARPASVLGFETRFRSGASVDVRYDPADPEWVVIVPRHSVWSGLRGLRPEVNLTTPFSLFVMALGLALVLITQGIQLLWYRT